MNEKADALYQAYQEAMKKHDENAKEYDAAFAALRKSWQEDTNLDVKYALQTTYNRIQELYLASMKASDQAWNKYNEAWFESMHKES